MSYRIEEHGTRTPMVIELSFTDAMLRAGELAPTVPHGVVVVDEDDGKVVMTLVGRPAEPQPEQRPVRAMVCPVCRGPVSQVELSLARKCGKCSMRGRT